MRPRIVGITGPSGSGKSTLASAVRAAHGCAVIIQQDWYFRSPSDCPEDANFCELRWLHVDELVRHVALLAAGEGADVPVIDFSTFERCGTTLIKPASLVIVEGMTILRILELDALLDARFYLDSDITTIAKRKRVRDIEERRKPPAIVEAQLRWIEAEYYADEPLRQRSDVVVLGMPSDPAEHVGIVLASQARRNQPGSSCR